MYFTTDLAVYRFKKGSYTKEKLKRICYPRLYSKVGMCGSSPLCSRVELVSKPNKASDCYQEDVCSFSFEYSQYEADGWFNSKIDFAACFDFIEKQMIPVRYKSTNGVMGDFVSLSGDYMLAELKLILTVMFRPNDLADRLSNKRYPRFELARYIDNLKT